MNYRFKFIEEGVSKNYGYPEGLTAEVWDVESQTYVPVMVSYETITECYRVARCAHGNARFWLRRGDVRRARRAYRRAAAHCRVLGFLPWALNVASRKGEGYEFPIEEMKLSAEYFLSRY